MNLLPYVISSRVRVARNLQHYRFPQMASEQERQAIAECVYTAIREHPSFRDATILPIDRLTPLERKVFAEKHLISHFFATQGSARLAIFLETEQASILINEEDHLRIQALSRGLVLQKTWRIVNTLEQALQESLQFAYSKHEGYVTSCPQNSGSGIRASVMLFLPALSLLHRLTPLMKQCIAAGYTARGSYGEGSQSQASIIQMSAQQPGKRDVTNIVKELTKLCHQVIRQEKHARLRLLTTSRPLLHKRMIWAKKQFLSRKGLTVNTAATILALYRLGVSLDMTPPFFQKRQLTKRAKQRHLQRLDSLLVQIQPAHIRQQAWDGENEDEIRSQILQKGLREAVCS